MKKNDSTTIIRRSGRKSGHNPHRGGWKVAFADFTLAMMALFMVLWIAATLNQEQRHTIAAKLQGEDLTTSSHSFNPLHMHGDPGNMTLRDNSAAFAPVAMSNTPATSPETIKIAKLNNVRWDSSVKGQGAKHIADENIKELDDLKRRVSTILRNMNAENNVTLESLPQGLRILIQDSSQRMMFTRGSAIMTPYFQRLLKELVPVFDQLDNHLLINGHTDSVRYSDNGSYDNWNLSSDRALTAQRVMKLAGLRDDQIIQVSGMADSTLLDKDNPQADKNRRIEIMVLTKKASDALYALLGYNGQKVVQAAAGKLK